MRRIKTFFKVLRSILIFRMLEKYTQPEFVRVVMFGAYVVHENDLVVFNNDGQRELGQVVAVEDAFHGMAPAKVVNVRIYRRPK